MGTCTVRRVRPALRRARDNKECLYENSRDRQRGTGVRRAQSAAYILTSTGDRKERKNDSKESAQYDLVTVASITTLELLHSRSHTSVVRTGSNSSNDDVREHLHHVPAAVDSLKLPADLSATVPLMRAKSMQLQPRHEQETSESPAGSCGHAPPNTPVDPVTLPVAVLDAARRPDQQQGTDGTSAGTGGRSLPPSSTTTTKLSLDDFIKENLIRLRHHTRRRRSSFQSRGSEVSNLVSVIESPTKHTATTAFLRSAVPPPSSSSIAQTPARPNIDLTLHTVRLN